MSFRVPSDLLPPMQHQDDNIIRPTAAAYQTAGAICAEATRLMEGPGARRHGDKVENTENIARLWGSYLGIPVTAKDAALMMTLLKVARTKTGEHNIDNYIDISGWGSMAGEIAERTEKGA